MTRPGGAHRAAGGHLSVSSERSSLTAQACVPVAELSGLALRLHGAVKPALQPSYPPASGKVLIYQVSVSLWSSCPGKRRPPGCKVYQL